ncbi:MAG: hydrogenase maturation protease [Spirochaetes bacterium]|nr:hydrogenase maturation protease [Spirochaetota bacterium]
MMKILCYGYGNPGRSDDGLGLSFVKKIEDLNLQGVNTEVAFQLNVEDSELVSHYNLVVFIDASENEIDGFRISQIEPAKVITFTTHAMSPASVMAFCSEIYNKNPPAYLLEIQGFDWEFKEGLSEPARKNLQNALDYTVQFIKKQMT